VDSEPVRLSSEPLDFSGGITASTLFYLFAKDDGSPPPELNYLGADTFTWFEVADDEGVIVRVNEDFEVEWFGSKERLRTALLRWYASQRVAHG
jgi:hypothetical protein